MVNHGACHTDLGLAEEQAAPHIFLSATSVLATSAHFLLFLCRSGVKREFDEFLEDDEELYPTKKVNALSPAAGTAVWDSEGDFHISFPFRRQELHWKCASRPK